MALDLTFQVTADASQAKAELRSVEQQIQKVENANKSSVGWWQKEEQAIDSVTGTLITHRGELSKTEQAAVKLASSVATAATNSEKLGSVSVSTGNALVGMSSGAEGVASQLLAITGASEMTVGSLVAITGAIGALLGVFAAFVGLLASSAAYYVEHGKGAQGLRDEWTHLQSVWEDMQLAIGQAIVGGAESPLIVFMHLAEEAAVTWAAKLVIGLNVLKDIISNIPLVGSFMSGLGGMSDTDPTKNFTARMRGGKDLFLPTEASDVQLPGSFLDFELDQPTSDAITRNYYKEQKRLAAQRARQAAQLAASMQIPYHEGLGSMPGDKVNLFQAGLGNYNIPNIPYHLGLGSAPGLQYDVSKPTIDPGFLSRLFGKGGIGGDLGSTLMGLLVQRGSAGSALGGSLGGSVMDSLMAKGSGSAKSISGALSGLFGGKVGGAIGNFLPFGGQILGSLVGKLFGGLFGETQGHKDLTEGNKQIDDMKAQLMGVYGTMQNLQSVGKMFGIDWQQTWGDQNLAGAKHFQSVLDDLAKKQAKFNDDLGGTLGKIKDLGGNVPEALIPYLDQLKDAKVLTQENIDLIATMSGQNTVDFDKMEEAANRYGISIDALGQAFKDHKMHEGWQQIIDDLDLLQRGGADMNAILGSDGMQQKINELVQQSIAFGTTIPENMRPFIQKLIDSGKLLGANGEAIKDIDQLKFGETMQTTLEKLNDTLKELIDTLAVKLPAAAHAGANGVNSAFDGIHLPGGSGPGAGKPNPGDGGDSVPRPAALRVAQPIQLTMGGRVVTQAVAQIVVRQ